MVLALVPLLLVTVTSTVPLDCCGGASAMMNEPPNCRKNAWRVPKLTFVTVPKFFPWMNTSENAPPELGLTLDTIGRLACVTVSVAAFEVAEATAFVNTAR